MSRLTELLESIDPDRVQDEVQRRLDEAIDSFRIPPGSSQSHEGFVNCMARVFRHVENTVLRLRRPLEVDLDMDFGRCCQFLRRIYGPAGEITACQIALSGVEGGLHGVLENVGVKMAEGYAMAETSARVAQYWNSLSTDEKWDATEEFLVRYSSLLPLDVTQGGAARVRAYLPKFLEQHPNLVRRIRGVGR